MGFVLDEFFHSFHNSIVDSVSLLIDNELFFIALVSFIVFLRFHSDRKKMLKVAVSIVVAVLVGSFLKHEFAVPRPCSIDGEFLVNGADCSGYSFPSIHSLVAFMLAVSLIDEPDFLLFLAGSLFVAFSRIYLGVHSFVDVSGSLALAPIMYLLVDAVWKRLMK